MKDEVLTELWNIKDSITKEEFNHGGHGGTELRLCFAELARISLVIYRHPLRLCALAGEQKKNFNKQVLSTQRGATLPSGPET